ncbi:MAG: HAMP domain-containing sensor histidine kinase [Actinomycetota bacterium]
MRKAVACETATVQVLMPDHAGRLRVFAVAGDPIARGRLRSDRRRQVFGSLRPQRIALGEPQGWSIGIYPLVADDEAIGVMEVVAPSRNLEERREAIDAVVGQSANVFRSVVDGQDRASAVRSMGIMLRLAADLLRAETPSSAVRCAVQRCFERFGSPIVGLLPDRSGTGWFVTAAGVGADRRVTLRRSIEEISALDRSRSSRDRLAARFAAIVGRDHAEAVEAGSAVLLAVDVQPGQRSILQTAGSLLSESLDHIGSVGWARVRNDHLDLALACTAHELRGPLAGARAALDHVEIDDPGPQSRELLRQTKDELEQLAELVDPLLRWSAGPSSLDKSQVDLVRLVREAAASCSLEPEVAEVIIDAPDQLMVWADGPQLRGAIGNVVRNALAYSPSSEPVTVIVEERDAVVRVRVRDRGRGVPPGERHLIFDPFARGRAGNGARDGRGLGLFIARRIVEAHGGSIGLRSGRPGAEFCIELPSSDGGRRLSAS